VCLVQGHSAEAECYSWLHSSLSKQHELSSCHDLAHAEGFRDLGMLREVSLLSKGSQSRSGHRCINKRGCWVFTAVHGLSLVAVGGLFTVMASLVVEHRL